MKPRARQRGVALLTGVVLVALATVLAVAIGFQTALTQRRGVGAFSVEQGMQLALGAENLAAFALREDLRQGQGQPGSQAAGGTPPGAQRDTPADAWTQPYGPVEVHEGVVLEAQLGDEQGKFNLNMLLAPDGTPDPDALAVFTALLQLLEIEPRWAQLLVDWLDEDTTPLGDGGEDNLYTSQTPPYRTANGFITSPSELMQLPGFGRERYLRLLPHVTALPPGSRIINVCFASPVVLDALTSGLAGSLAKDYMNADPEQFRQQRGGGCYPGITALEAPLQADRRARLRQLIGEESRYFRLQTWVSIGTTRFALYSLLERQNGEVQTLLRSFGTE